MIKKILCIHIQILLFTLLIASCNTTPSIKKTLKEVSPPNWVLKGGGAYKDSSRKALYGVGSASMIKNFSLKRIASDNRARNDLAKVIEFYTKSLSKDYQASQSSKPNRYTDDEQIVENAIDLRSNLMWMVNDFRNIEGRGLRNFHEIDWWVNKINNKRYAGFSNWRIPSISEYKNIFDSRRMRLGYSIKETKNLFNRIMNAKPVGYPKVFKNGGGYWYWSNEQDIRCGKILNALGGCYRVYSFRDGVASSHSIYTKDNDTSSVRLVRSMR